MQPILHVSKRIEISGMLIHYDRSGREWLIERNGEILQHLPSGAAGKEAAISEAIHLADEELYEMARYMQLKNPALGKRIWKATQLVANAHVIPPRPGNLVNEVGQVISATDECIIYTIQRRDCLLCNCEDYQFEKAPRLGSGQKYCKHILAYLMDKRRKTLKSELEEEPEYAI